MPVPTPIDLSSMIEPQDPVEAVILFTRTGKLLASWARSDVPLEVVTVMAATLVGSVETLSTALGAASPREIALVVDARRILGFKLNPDVAILIVASGHASDVTLKAVAERIVERVRPLPDVARGETPRTPRKAR